MSDDSAPPPIGPPPIGPPPNDPPTNDPPTPGRLSERFDVDWRVQLKVPSWAAAARVAAANASRTGVFLLTTRPPPIGTMVTLTIGLPDGRAVDVEAEVVRVVTPEQAAVEGATHGPGVGVRFRDNGIDLALLESQARGGLSGAHLPSADEPVEEPVEVPILATPPSSSPSSSPSPSLAPATTPAHRRIVRALPRGRHAAALGIDFGTSTTSAAIAIGDTVHLVPDRDGRVLHPSVVHFPAHGPPVAGWAAYERLGVDPRRTIPSVKRLLGRRLADPAVASYLQSVCYRARSGPDGKVVVDLDGEQHAAVELCAQMLAHVRSLAEEQLGAPIERAGFSVPVTYTETERMALRSAAQLAGLEVVALLEEPHASAMAYGASMDKNEIVAVYDLGGGTFDFTVLDLTGENFRVLGSEGDGWLGGDDIDLMLAEVVANAFWRATRVELRGRVREWQRLLLACESAKRQLSSGESAIIVVPGIVESPQRIDLRQRLTRDLFDRLTHEVFERTFTLSQQALARIGLDPTDMTQLVVAGGMSHVPAVRRGLARLFERDVTTVVNPDEAIALGVGLAAARAVDHDARSIAG